MDHFGIGQAMRSMALVYSQSARQSGRTTSLIESVKDGDRITFTDRREAERVKRLCAERGVTVDCVVIDPNHLEHIFSMGTPQGRMIFDHSWVERYYLQAIEDAAARLDSLQRQASGFGTAHYETAAAAREIARWNF